VSFSDYPVFPLLPCALTVRIGHASRRLPHPFKVFALKLFATCPVGFHQLALVSSSGRAENGPGVLDPKALGPAVAALLSVLLHRRMKPKRAVGTSQKSELTEVNSESSEAPGSRSSRGAGLPSPTGTRS
jgi:hypothetical protein